MKHLVLMRWQLDSAFLSEGSRRGEKLFATWQLALAKKADTSTIVSQDIKWP